MFFSPLGEPDVLPQHAELERDGVERLRAHARIIPMHGKEAEASVLETQHLQ